MVGRRSACSKLTEKSKPPRQIVAVPTLCAVVVDVETIGSDCCAQLEKVSIVNRTLVDGQAGRKGKCEARSKTFPSARESAPVSGTVHQRFCRFVCFVLAFFSSVLSLKQCDYDITRGGCPQPDRVTELVAQNEQADIHTTTHTDTHATGWHSKRVFEGAQWRLNETCFQEPIFVHFNFQKIIKNKTTYD